MKKIDLLIILFTFLSLVACTDLNDPSTETHAIENNKPPALTITSGEEVVKSVQGTYSWNYIESETGDMVSIESDSLPPTELVNLDNAVRVNLADALTLNFQIEPEHYEIRIYDDHDQVIATYDDVKDVQEKGKAVFEILVTYEQGTSSYAVALDIH